MIPEGTFPLPGSRRHYGRSHSVDIVHIDLAVRPFLAQRTLNGVCTITIAAIDSAVMRVALDARDLRVDAVEDSSGSLEFMHRDGTLTIELCTPLEPTARTTLAVAYHIEQPRRGLYFVSAGDAPDATLQCWTHGHAGGARYWFPCVDEPYQRQTSSMTIEVERGYFAVANGELVARRENVPNATTIFQYAQTQRHAAAVFSLVVGQFTEITRNYNSIAVSAYVAPGREGAAARTFGKTPTMIAALERFTGRAYPYARYSQIAVADFPFIGMENTTAPTFTDEWLLDERTLASPAVESLVVHELAHQWFGNLLPTAEWTDVWLNEGFASYCEAVWDEAQSGWDAYAYNIYRQLKAYVAEATLKYTRPIVCDYFRDPIDLFDKHLYEKAGAVLHMLRGELGPARFARAIARYVGDNAGKAVETIDLVRAIEASTGRNMRAFFDQWLRRSGHPVVTVTVAYDVQRRLLQVRFTQHQRMNEMHPAFRFTIVVGILECLPEHEHCVSGSASLAGERRISVEIDCAVSECTIALDRPPALLRIDPGAWVVGEFALELGSELGRATLTNDPDPIARIRAAHALARDGGEQARTALATAMQDDAFWGARAEYAGILADTRAPWARATLLAALSDGEPKVRRAVCRGLGNYRGPDIAAALLALVAGEPAVEVVGDALHALGKTGAPGVVDRLAGALSERSWRDVVGGGALLGLAETGTEDARTLLLDALGSSWANRRQSALRALAVLAVRRPLERDLIVGHLVEALDDEVAMTRLGAIDALDELVDVAAVAHLERIALREPIAWIRSHADRAALRMRSAVRGLQRLDQSNLELQTLRGDHERLRQRIDAGER